jgi:hypothetical protein
MVNLSLAKTFNGHPNILTSCSLPILLNDSTRNDTAQTINLPRRHNPSNCIFIKQHTCNLIQTDFNNSIKVSKEPDKTPHLSSQAKIVHLNIRSLKNKTHFIEITNFIKLNNVDVLTLSETWLNTTTRRYQNVVFFKCSQFSNIYKWLNKGEFRSRPISAFVYIFALSQSECVKRFIT